MLRNKCLHTDLKFNNGNAKCFDCNTYLWDMSDEEVRRLITYPEYLINNRNKLKEKLNEEAL
jgi:uncharacterized protein with PIN domain